MFKILELGDVRPVHFFLLEFCLIHFCVYIRSGIPVSRWHQCFHSFEKSLSITSSIRAIWRIQWPRMFMAMTMITCAMWLSLLLALLSSYLLPQLAFV